MRRLRKQGVAIVMAAMMMASGMQGSTGFIAPATVMAATEESVYDNNTEQKLDIDFSALEGEQWNEVGKKLLDYAYTNEEPFQVDKNFNMTAKIKIDQQAYESISTDGAYLKVKGVVSFRDWAYKDANVNNCFYLDKNNFNISDDGNYYADIDYGFKDTKGGEIWKVGFEVVGAKFKGTLNFTDVSVKNVKVDSKTETKEILVYENKGTEYSNACDFSENAATDWDHPVNKEIEIKDYNVATKKKVVTKISLDKDTYESLNQDERNITIKVGLSLGDNWDWSEAGYKELKASDFSEENGKY